MIKAKKRNMLAKEIDIIMHSIINRRMDDDWVVGTPMSNSEYFKNKLFNLDSSKLTVTYHYSYSNLYDDIKSRKNPPSLIIYDLRKFPEMDTEEWLFHRVTNKRFPGIKKIGCLGKLYVPSQYIITNSKGKSEVSSECVYEKAFGKEYIDEIIHPDNLKIDGASIEEKETISKYMLKKVNELIDIGFIAFTYTPLLDKLLDSETKSLLRFILNDKPSKLHMLVAPSGFGKTSLIEELKYCGVKQLPKITTREYRPLLNFFNLRRNNFQFKTSPSEFKEELKKEFGKNYKEKFLTELSEEIGPEFNNSTTSRMFFEEILEIFNEQQTNNIFGEEKIKSISPSRFNKKVNNKEILGSHFYKGNMYGFEKKELDKLLDSTNQYVFDTCDLETALRVREENEGRIEIVGIFPSLSFAGFGLEKRIETYKENNLSSNIIIETKKRLNQIIEDSRFIEENHDKFDLILDKDSTKENRNTFLEYMSKE